MIKLLCVAIFALLLTSCSAAGTKGEILTQLDGDDRSVVIDLGVIDGDWTRVVLACPGASDQAIKQALGFGSEGVVDLRDSDDQVLIFVDQDSVLESVRFSPADRIALCVSSNPGVSPPAPVAIADRVGLVIELVRVDAEDNDLLGNADLWIAREPLGMDPGGS